MRPVVPKFTTKVGVISMYSKPGPLSSAFSSDFACASRGSRHRSIRQARRAIGNIEAILKAAGASLADVVKVTVYLRNPEDAPAFNEEYKKLMPEPLPARASAYVNLKSPDMLVEMDAIAVIPEG